MNIYSLSYDEWTADDESYAAKQGWHLAVTTQGMVVPINHASHNSYTTPIFSTDEEAYNFILDAAHAGDEIAMKAIAIITARRLTA